MGRRSFSLEEKKGTMESRVVRNGKDTAGKTCMTDRRNTTDETWATFAADTVFSSAFSSTSASASATFYLPGLVHRDRCSHSLFYPFSQLPYIGPVDTFVISLHPGIGLRSPRSFRTYTCGMTYLPTWRLGRWSIELLYKVVHYLTIISPNARNAYVDRDCRTFME